MIFLRRMRGRKEEVMNRIFVTVCATLLMVFLALPAAAATMYVSDQLAVNLRDQPASGAKPLKLLRTDAAMEVLGEQGDYFRVRLDDGVEGFFPKRYATKRQPRTRIITRLEKQIEKLESELAAARQRLGSASGELEAERQQLVEKLQATEAQMSELQQQQTELLNERDATLQKYDQLVADASNVVELANVRDRLKGENAKLLEEMETLRKENESLLISGLIKWFLAGGGVLFFGWLMGRASRRKRGGLSGY